MVITILVDNKTSWIVPYAELLVKELSSDHDIQLVHESKQIPTGDIACFLSCENIIKKEIRARNKHNLVVHESALPQGKGWSPMTWQILEGKNEIPMTLFEAEDLVDNGVIYGWKILHFAGNELIDQMRKAQGEATIEMIKKFVASFPDNFGTPQRGDETFYSRRTPKDSELDANKTIAEQFNLLRVVDNERYPAFFNHKGKKYIIKIYQEPLDDLNDLYKGSCIF